MSKDTSKSQYALAAAMLTLAATIKEENALKYAREQGKNLNTDDILRIQDWHQTEVQENFECFLQKIS